MGNPVTWSDPSGYFSSTLTQTHSGRNALIVGEAIGHFAKRLYAPILLPIAIGAAATLIAHLPTIYDWLDDLIPDSQTPQPTTPGGPIALPVNPARPYDSIKDWTGDKVIPIPRSVPRDHSDPDPDTETFVGYHGTSSTFQSTMMSGLGVINMAGRSGTWQLGPGFYVSTPDAAGRQVANIYANQAATRTNGSPIVFEVWVKNFEQMRGAGVPLNSWYTRNINFSSWLLYAYDYLVAPFDDPDVYREVPGAIQIKFNPIPVLSGRVTVRNPTNVSGG